MKYKEIIQSVVVEAHDHPTAEQIYMRSKEITPKISMATVYNNLNTLVAENKIRKISMEIGGDRYDKTIPHAHLVCVSCSQVEDTMFFDITDKLSEKSGKDVLFYDLKIMHLCDK